MTSKIISLIDENIVHLYIHHIKKSMHQKVGIGAETDLYSVPLI